MIGMAKWVCPCGNTIRSSGAIPNPQEWHIVSDVNVDAVASAAPLPDDDAIVTFHRLTHLVYRCERCDRLHIFWNPDQWPPSIYAPEPDAYNH